MFTAVVHPRALDMHGSIPMNVHNTLTSAYVVAVYYQVVEERTLNFIPAATSHLKSGILINNYSSMS